jgi:hypothetical protein
LFYFHYYYRVTHGSAFRATWFCIFCDTGSAFFIFEGFQRGSKNQKVTRFLHVLCHRFCISRRTGGTFLGSNQLDLLSMNIEIEKNVYRDREKSQTLCTFKNPFSFALIKSLLYS